MGSFSTPKFLFFAVLSLFIPLWFTFQSQTMAPAPGKMLTGSVPREMAGREERDSASARLIERLLSSEDADTRLRIVREIGRMAGFPEVRHALEKALKDPDETVRLEALNLLAATDDPRLPGLLLEIQSSDPSPSMRRMAADFLETIPDNAPEMAPDQP